MLENVSAQLIFDGNSIVYIVSALLNLAVLIFLLFDKRKSNASNRKSKSKNYLIMLTVCCVLWMVASWINHFVNSSDIITVTTRLAFTVCVIGEFSILFFILDWQERKISHLWVLLMIAISGFTMFTPLVIKKEIPATLTQIEQPVWGDYFQLWSLVVGSLGIYILMEYIRAFIVSTGSKKEKIKIILFLFCVLIVAILICNLILPNLGINDLMFFGQFSTFTLAFGITWVTLKDNIYSITYIIANVLTTIITGLVFFLFSWGTQKIEQVVFNWNITKIIDIKIFLFGLSVASFVALFINNINPFIRKFVYKLLNISYLNLDKIKEYLINESNKYVDFNDFMPGFLKNLADILNSEEIIFYIEKYSIFWSSKKKSKVNITYLKKNKTKDIFISNDDEDEFSMILPLDSGQESLAYLFIRPKNNLAFYSLEEINGVKSLLKLLSIATYKYNFFKDQQEFVHTLQHEVDKATKELQENYEKLNDAYRKEKDILDILGHELRTPLSIAKNASMFMEDLLKKGELSEEQTKKYSNMISDNLSRLSRTLETILTGTKIENGKVNLVLEKLVVSELAKNSLHAFKHLAKDKKLELKSTVPSDIEIYADKIRMQEVIDNLTENAIKYTNAGSVTLSATSKGKYVEISVTDTGIGIKKEEIKNLGKKVYRVGNYIEDSENTVRAGGTGLGLFVSFNLVKLMKGKIEIESVFGKGSTFTVIMPAYVGQDPQTINPHNIGDKFKEIKSKLNKENEDK